MSRIIGIRGTALRPVEMGSASMGSGRTLSGAVPVPIKPTPKPIGRRLKTGSPIVSGGKPPNRVPSSIQMKRPGPQG